MCPDPSSVLSTAPGESDPCHIWVRGSKDLKNMQCRIVCVSPCPPMSPPNEWDYFNRLGRVPLLSRIPALVLEHGLVWLDVVPIQCEIGAIFTHRWCDFWNGSRCG